jgi:enoyl-CoA hydratase/carnithine racemase
MNGSVPADLDVVFEAPLARIRIHRPERRNAMSRAMWLALADAAWAIEARADIRVALVQGSGGHFCAGADISEFDEVYRDPEATRDYLAAIESGLAALAGLARPTIALLEGSSIGGGLAIGLACDLRFAAEDAHIAAPPAKLGLLYGPVETRRLVELVGPSRAKDLLFSGRRVQTDEALAIGLVDRRVPAVSLHTEAEAYARDLAGLSRASIRGAKAMVEATLAGEPADGLRALVEAAANGEDFREGRAAFGEKRRPRFG